MDLVEGARQGNIDLHTVAFSTGVTLREITERVKPIEKKSEVVVEKKPKASNSSKGPQLTDLQKQILAAEEKESSLSEYEKAGEHEREAGHAGDAEYGGGKGRAEGSGAKERI